MIIIAELMSFLLHPVLFLLLMPFLVMYRHTSDGLYALKWLIFSSIFIFLGITLFFIGRVRGTFSDIDLSRKKEREVFYMIAWFLAILYLLVAVFFKGIFFPLSLAALGIVAGLTIFEVVTYKVKASIHVGAVCAWVVTLGLLYGLKAFLIASVLVFLVAWSRLVLKRHTLEEVIIGGFLGSAVTFLTFLIGRELL